MCLKTESIAIQIQGLTSFIYDSYINKYGLLDVAERKLKELLFSSSINRRKVLKIEIFSRFVGLSEVYYTADDMQFMFTMVLKFIQTYNFNYIIHF